MEMSIPDIEAMGSLFQKMTVDTKEELKLNNNQVNNIVEILIPRIAVNLPGMPHGMKCTVDRDEKGWTIRIDRPEAMYEVL